MTGAAADRRFLLLPTPTRGTSHRIGWRYVDNDPPVSIVTMERNPNRRVHKADLVLSRHEREALLLEWGFTLPEIVDSVRAIVRIKHQRRRTVNNARYERVWEDVVVKPATLIKKKFRKSSSSSQQRQNAVSHEQQMADHHDRMMEAPVDFKSVIDSSVCDAPPSMPRRSAEETEVEEFEDDSLFVMDDDPVIYIYEQEEISSAGNATLGSDGNFDLLVRDTSYWELERNNAMYPKISRKALAIVVSEEPIEDYAAQPPHSDFNFGAPPYYSQNRAPLVSRWE
jgi:hypothetical protein